MLSEEVKQTLIATHKMVVREHGNVCDNPAEAIQAVIDCDYESGETEEARHIEDNRKEAEHFVAGLMGMM